MTAYRQDLKALAFDFAATILKMYNRLASGGPAHAHMAQQLFEAASAIGAMLEEGEVANSRRDMASKHAIALREARESNHWLRLFSTIPEWKEELAPLVQESLEFVRMLTVSVRKLRTPTEDIKAEGTGQNAKVRSKRQRAEDPPSAL
jgi:four helix bundle protein